MRKVKDHFYYRAKKEGYPARSVYKLQEIDGKYGIIKKGYRVLDLGASPGSWAEYCISVTGKTGLVVCVDKKKVNINGAVFLRGDILNMDIHRIKDISPSFNAVLSDMAPSTTGIRSVDQRRQLDLAEAAFSTARRVLVPSGHFVCKLFQGPDTKAFIDKVIPFFSRLKIIKPAGSRKESMEIYIAGISCRTQSRRIPDPAG